jgi:hypothetical protein
MESEPAVVSTNSKLLKEAAERHDMAMVYYQSENNKKALELLLLAFGEYYRTLGLDHPDTESVIADMRKVFIDNGGKKKAFPLWLEEQMEVAESQ